MFVFFSADCALFLFKNYLLLQKNMCTNLFKRACFIICKEVFVKQPSVRLGVEGGNRYGRERKQNKYEFCSSNFLFLFTVLIYVQLSLLDVFLFCVGRFVWFSQCFSSDNRQKLLLCVGVCCCSVFAYHLIANSKKYI